MPNYADLNTKYNVNTNDDPIVIDLQSVRIGLERLLQTPKGHNPFNREYGSSLYNMLFENNTDIAAIKMFLYMDITNWEPRLSINPNEISIEKLDNNTYKVNCAFVLNNIASGISTIVARE